jgi:hypothetical protein
MACAVQKICTKVKAKSLQFLNTFSDGPANPQGAKRLPSCSCHENSMTRRDHHASVHALGSEHTTIFIHNGAPQALVGCLERN